MADALTPQTCQMVARIVAIHSSKEPRSLAASDSLADLSQEALLEVWQKSSRFNPARGSWSTFCDRIIANRIRSLHRRERAGYRGYGKQCPLHEGRREPAAPISKIDLQIDMEQILGRLPAADRAVAASLAQCSVAETSRRLGIRRASVYRVIMRLRNCFSRVGLVPNYSKTQE